LVPEADVVLEAPLEPAPEPVPMLVVVALVPAPLAVLEEPEEPAVVVPLEVASPGRLTVACLARAW
jgi:hypothetical protein